MCRQRLDPKHPGLDALKSMGLRPAESARNLVLTAARVNPSARAKGACIYRDKIARHSSKGLRQAGLTKDRVRCVAARDAERYSKVSLGDRALPNLVAALALPHRHATSGAQQITQGLVELRRHSRGGGLGFAQGRDLEKQRGGINARMVVREEVKRHRRDLLPTVRRAWVHRRRPECHRSDRSKPRRPDPRRRKS